MCNQWVEKDLDNLAGHLWVLLFCSEMTDINNCRRCTGRVIYQRKCVNSSPGPIIGRGFPIKSQPIVIQEVSPKSRLPKICKRNKRPMNIRNRGQVEEIDPSFSTSHQSTLSPSPPGCIASENKRNLTTQTAIHHLPFSPLSVSSLCNSSACNSEYFSLVHSLPQSQETQKNSMKIGYYSTNSSQPISLSRSLKNGQFLKKSYKSLPKILSRSLEMDRSKHGFLPEKTCSANIGGNDYNTGKIRSGNTTCLYNFKFCKNQQESRKSEAIDYREQPGGSTSVINLSKVIKMNLNARSVLEKNDSEIASHLKRKCVPLEKNILGSKKKEMQSNSNSCCTSYPKVNANSIKVMEDRNTRLYQVL